MKHSTSASSANTVYHVHPYQERPEYVACDVETGWTSVTVPTIARAAALARAYGKANPDRVATVCAVDPARRPSPSASAPF